MIWYRISTKWINKFPFYRYIQYKYTQRNKKICWISHWNNIFLIMWFMSSYIKIDFWWICANRGVNCLLQNCLCASHKKCKKTVKFNIKNPTKKIEKNEIKQFCLNILNYTFLYWIKSKNLIQMVFFCKYLFFICFFF